MQMTTKEAIEKALFLRKQPEMLLSDSGAKVLINTLLSALEASPCYLKAVQADMPTFVLIASDVAATRAVGDWITRRIELGKNKHDDPKIVDAMAVAERMQAWRKANN